MTVQVELGNPSYLFGNSNRLYGVPVTTRTTFIWSIEIDWDNDRIFNGANEAIYCIDLQTDRGFSELYDVGDDGNALFGPAPMLGSCTMVFDNATERFSAWSSATASLGLDVMPGRLVRIKVRKDYTGTDQPVFTGIIKNITEDFNNKTVTVECVDMVEYLQEKSVSFALNTSMTEMTTLNRAIDMIAQDINYPFNLSYPGDKLYIPYFFAKNSALTSLLALARSLVGSRLFIAADGTITFDTMYGVDTFTRYDYSASQLLKKIDISQPWQNVKNRVRMRTNNLAPGTNATLWEQGAIPTQIAASSTVEIFVEYQTSDTLLVAVPDAMTTPAHYVANTASDGSGTDKSANISIVVTDFGTSAKLEITNNYAGLIHLTTFKMTGVPYYKSTSVINADTTDYLGVGTKTITTSQLALVNDDGITPYTPIPVLLSYLGYPHTTKSVTVMLQTRAEQFERDINAYVGFLITSPDIYPTAVPDGGVYGDTHYNTFRISRIQHKWLSSTGQDISTTWFCQHALLAVPPI